VAGRPADHLTLGRDGETLARRLGARLRQRRLALDRTLADVAGEAALSVSYLSAVEKGVNMPSLPVLARLVHALRLTLHELLREEDPLQVRSGDMATEEPGEQELDHPDLRLRVVSLVSRPGDRGEAPLPVLGFTIFVFVERGALALEVDGALYALGQGDALDAVDVRDIRWETLGETPAVSLWGVSRARSAAGL
jgi:transcriptional regulator with XRE-family HTH domain